MFKLLKYNLLLVKKLPPILPPFPRKKKMMRIDSLWPVQGTGGRGYLSVRSALHLTPPQPILTPSIQDTPSSFSHAAYCDWVCCPC